MTTSDVSESLFYARAYEALMWAAPAVAVMAQVEAGQRDLGAGEHDIIFTGQELDHRWGGITYNNQSPYWVAGFSLENGPIVVEIPAARDDARFFGSIHDVWWLPLEDFGPAGADEGRGAKYLVVPPGYDGATPDGHVLLRSGSFLNFIPGRTILRDAGQAAWDAAVDYIKTIRIYSLAEASDPRPNRFIDGAKTTYDAQPRYDLSDYELIHRLVQQEPVREYDKAMHGLLAEIGIEKGRPFNPSPLQVSILEQAAADVQAFAIDAIHDGSAWLAFWEDRVWGSFRLTAEIAAGGASFVFDDRVDYLHRLTTMFYFSGGMYKNFDADKPSTTSYFWTGRDTDGEALDPARTYRIEIPADPPMRDFWSIIAYGAKSRTFTNSPRFTVASSDEGMTVNEDESVSVFLGPTPVAGFEQNTVITNPTDEYFLCFRLYGAEPGLWDKTWKLGDPQPID